MMNFLSCFPSSFDEKCAASSCSGINSLGSIFVISLSLGSRQSMSSKSAQSSSSFFTSRGVTSQSGWKLELGGRPRGSRSIISIFYTLPTNQHLDAQTKHRPNPHTRRITNPITPQKSLPKQNRNPRDRSQFNDPIRLIELECFDRDANQIRNQTHPPDRPTHKQKSHPKINARRRQHVTRICRHQLRQMPREPSQRKPRGYVQCNQQQIHPSPRDHASPQ